MFNSQMTRRGFATAAVTGIAAAGLVGATVSSAVAYQGNIGTCGRVAIPGAGRTAAGDSQ